MSKKVFSSTTAMIVASLGIVLNIVCSMIVKLFGIPLLFLDTIGTIFVSVTLGPWIGAMTGGLTNVITGVLNNPKSIPFAIVNIAVAVVVGGIAKKYDFNLKIAIITGIILSIVAPLIGTPIAVLVYGGITGDGNDLIFTWLQASGHKIFTAAFIPRITGNIIDKIASCMVVSFLLTRLPMEQLSIVNVNKNAKK